MAKDKNGWLTYRVGYLTSLLLTNKSGISLAGKVALGYRLPVAAQYFHQGDDEDIGISDDDGDAVQGGRGNQRDQFFVEAFEGYLVMKEEDVNADIKREALIEVV